VFDPPPGKHGWLRGKTFVGRGIRMPDHVLNSTVSSEPPRSPEKDEK
jgi:hypothetical protein